MFGLSDLLSPITDLFTGAIPHGEAAPLQGGNGNPNGQAVSDSLAHVKTQLGEGPKGLPIGADAAEFRKQAEHCLTPDQLARLEDVYTKNDPHDPPITTGRVDGG
jgi:hypothetical protein